MLSLRQSETPFCEISFDSDVHGKVYDQNILAQNDDGHFALLCGSCRVVKVPVAVVVYLSKQHYSINPGTHCQGGNHAQINIHRIYFHVTDVPTKFA